MNNIFQTSLSDSEKIEYLEKLENMLRNYIHTKRFAHTKGVEMTAVSMAMKYAYEIGLRGTEAKTYLFRVQIAGLLHDNAKCMTDDELISECDRLNISITEFEKAHAYLLHGKLGAAYLKERYEIEDDEIASAIAYHTTGRPGMTLMEQIIFVADYIEPSRTKQKNLELVRYLAMTDLNTCVFKIADDTLSYLSNVSYDIDDMTIQTKEYYEKLADFSLLKG